MDTRQNDKEWNFPPISFLTTFGDIHILSNFLDVIKTFRSHMPVVKESLSFKLCLHCIAYRISLCIHWIDGNNSCSKHSAELSRLRYIERPDEDVKLLETVEMNYYRQEMAALSELLEQARRRGLDQDVDNVTRACKLNMDIRRLARLSEDEANSGRWDIVLRNIADAVNLLDQRSRAWPSWFKVEKARQEIMDPVMLFGYEDIYEAEWLILIFLRRVSYSFLPPHSAGVSRYVKFHSRYLDEELGSMARFVTERSADSIVQVAGNLLAADDTEFYELSAIGLMYFNANLLTHWFGLRIYRMCLSFEEWVLADKTMKLRFTSNPDQQEVTDLIDQMLTKLRNNIPRHGGIVLNGEHEHTMDEYELPKMILDVDPTPPGEPWWVEVFRRKNQSIPSPSNISSSSAAPKHISTTSEPSIWSSARFDMMMNQEPETIFDPMKENQDVARLFTRQNSIPDCETFNILFSYIDIPPAVDRCPITIKLKDHHERKTNIVLGVPYHCRVLTYFPIPDEWSVRSDMCRISGQLSVDQEGATCVPFVGDCGVSLRDDTFVFKIHKSRSNHALREYMADVRTQSMALWYVNRFRELTKDRFGVLMMLHSECVLVFQDSRRDTILELMTRELIFRGGSAIRFDKYMNNSQWKNAKVNTDLPEAFSHFTHHYSDGTLMVTDLQGWVGWNEVLDNINYILTDPVIHCPGYLYKFGCTNKRENGIDLFFRHVHPNCNHICEYLNLTRPEKYRVHGPNL